MGQAASGGVSKKDDLKMATKELSSALVVKDIRVISKTIDVLVPKFIEKIVELPVFIQKEIVVTDVKVEVKTITNEKIVFVDKPLVVERPVFKDVEVECVRVKYIDKEIINPILVSVEKVVEVPKFVEKVVVVEVPVEVRVYKMVEEIVKVPKIQYVPTVVERIVWKDVYREKCENCKKEILG